MSMPNPPYQANPVLDAVNLPQLAPDEMARICKAMGHPIRMRIIDFLKAEKKCFCGQIVSRLPLAQSTVSQHLKNLKDAGVIIGEVEGPGTCYCLNRPLLKQFRTSMARFLA
jgi:DNA-binding transcriptional ArsR family regulator